MREHTGESEVERDIRVVSEYVLGRGITGRDQIDECVVEIRRRYKRGDPKVPSLAEMLFQKKRLNSEQYQRIQKLGGESDSTAGSPGKALGITLAVVLAAVGALVWYAKTFRNDDVRRREALAVFQDALRLHEGGELDAAIALYTRALPGHPDPVDVHFRRGLARVARADAAGAVTDLTEVLKHQPQNVEALNQLGLARLAGGDTKGALADLEKALELESHRAKLYLARARVRLRLGDYDNALLDCGRAIDRDPNDPKSFATRAELLKLKGDLKGAEESWSFVISLTPRDPDALLERGLLRSGAGKKDDAAADFDEALRVAPQGWPRRSQATELVRRLRP